MYCKALLFPHEISKLNMYTSSTICCNYGNIRLPLFETLPYKLQELLTSNKPSCLYFRNHIRSYNTVFSFTSSRVKLDPTLKTTKSGIYSVKIQGISYVLSAPLSPIVSTALKGLNVMEDERGAAVTRASRFGPQKKQVRPDLAAQEKCGRSLAATNFIAVV